MTPYVVLEIAPLEQALARRLIAESGLADGAAFMARPEAVQAIVRALRIGMRLAEHQLDLHFNPHLTFCRVCSCQDLTACVVDDTPCHWVKPGLCSACAPYVLPERGA